ncbi:hypothetical protein GOBAR_DD22196 [Gossypium barbadense]|nr:hypothetical protein GOBAR_DD22196 [Gossypium barbadense]
MHSRDPNRSGAGPSTPERGKAETPETAATNAAQAAVTIPAPAKHRRGRMGSFGEGGRRSKFPYFSCFVFYLTLLCSQDVPYIFNLKWSMNSRLKNLVQQFEKHLEKLQGFWSTLDEIDRSLQIVDSKQASRAIPSRQIHVGNDCFIILFIDINDPRSLPECRFMGLGNTVNSLRKTWKRNVDKWERDKAFLENLECLLNTQLPRLADEETNNHLDECGICYAQYLPIGDELGPQTGSATDYTCENNSCSKAFHSMCLVDWLRSITTTRQSFNVLFGNCPYCSEPIAVKINATKN